MSNIEPGPGGNQPSSTSQSGPVDQADLRPFESFQTGGQEALPDYGAKGSVYPDFEDTVPAQREALQEVDFENLNVMPAWYASHPSSSAAEALQERVLGRDERRKVRDTSRFFPSAICCLEAYSNSHPGSVFLGTGWLVSPTVVITAGHCVYLRDGQTRRYFDRVKVFPGRQGSQLVGGEFEAASLVTTRGWVEQGNQAADFGAIRLSSEYKGRYFGFGSLEDHELRGATVNISGYPGSHRREQWGMVKRLVRVTHSNLFYDVDTSGGQSGAPVAFEFNNEWISVGVHNYGGQNTSQATRISDGVFNLLKTWKQADF